MDAEDAVPSKKGKAPETGAFCWVKDFAVGRYQLSLRANWNWRASKAALG